MIPRLLSMRQGELLRLCCAAIKANVNYILIDWHEKGLFLF